ncbi:MAG: PAS domain-containing sensor histidine kinase [Spirochaetales bacterium]|nr:PAS domain-containing sensor histidine kinase [Spirochaetales bacterium]
MNQTLLMFDPEATETGYLPAPREHEQKVLTQQSLLLASPLIVVMEDIPMLMMALNDKRQIVWMNRQARESFGEDALGLRPGEAIGCVHSCEKPGGCGTTAFCAYCGAPTAIMKALSGLNDSEECVIQRDKAHGSDSIDLMLWTKPITLDGETFVLMIAKDVSAQKRHEVMERVFYHDIGNTATGIRSILGLLESSPAEADEYLGLLRSAADQLLEEIDSQRAIKAAEEGRLDIELSNVEVQTVIEQAIQLFEYTLYGKDIRIIMESPAIGRQDITLRSDPALLRRIVINMLKNALEAARRGEVIKTGYNATDSTITIWVWNAATMDHDTAMRVFQRSFSTKGRGRGLGTYGMKLLAERYMGGTVSFESTAGAGTTFRATFRRDKEQAERLP